MVGGTRQGMTVGGGQGMVWVWWAGEMGLSGGCGSMFMATPFNALDTPEASVH